jgi:hypothetical protein
LPCCSLQEEEIPWVEPNGERVLVSRAFYRDHVNEGSWCKPEKQRACEYDAIYRWLQQHAVKLTAAENRPFTVLDAADRVQVEKDIAGKGQKGKMSIPKFMTFCVNELKELKELAAQADKAAKIAAKAAATAAAAAEDGERSEEGAAAAADGQDEA